MVTLGSSTVALATSEIVTPATLSAISAVQLDTRFRSVRVPDIIATPGIRELSPEITEQLLRPSRLPFAPEIGTLLPQRVLRTLVRQCPRCKT